VYTGVFSFGSQQQQQQASTCQSANIVELISSSLSVSQAGYCLFYLRPRTSSQSAVPVRLLYPVCRRAPASLVELSSVAVRRHYRRHNVDRLPVNADTRDFIKRHVFKAH